MHSLSPSPDTRDMQSHSHRVSGAFPKTTFIVEFDYPDCVRTFDGAKWTVTPKPPRGYTAEELEKDNPFNAWLYEGK